MTQVTLIPGRPAVTKIIEPATPEQVQITMDRKTAEVLQIILNNIGGHPESTLRGETDKLHYALNRAGINSYRGLSGGDTFERGLHYPPGVLYFKNGVL